MQNKFSENLKLCRTEKKLSQSDVAKMLGVTQQCVSEWELEKTEPTLTYLIKLSDLLEISMDVLCGKKDW